LTPLPQDGADYFVIPRYDLVIVATAGTHEFDRPVRFLYEDILPAVH